MLRSKGFAPADLVSIFAVIGMLSAIALPQFSSYRRHIRDSYAESALEAVISAQERYFIEHDVYAADLAALGEIAPPSGVKVRITNADTDSYAIEACHERGETLFSIDTDPSAPTPGETIRTRHGGACL